MTKKILAVLLALVLLAGAAPLASAGSYDDVWLLYCTDAAENTFDAIILAPAKYTRLSDDPRIETIYTDGHADSIVATPAAEQLQFYFDGEIGTRWAMTVTCPIPEGCVPGYCIKLAVLPGSVLDDAGNANPRVYFDNGVNYLSDRGYAEIDVYSDLLRRDYSRDDGTVAVGDTLRVDYSGLYPVEIFLNGEKAASLPRGEMQRYTCTVAATGPLEVVVRQGGEVMETRSMTVITSKEMYERNLRDGLITGEDIPSTEDLVDVGVPQGSPFIAIAKLIAFFVSLRDFLDRLFSFTRITE